MRNELMLCGAFIMMFSSAFVVIAALYVGMGYNYSSSAFFMGMLSVVMSLIGLVLLLVGYFIPSQRQQNVYSPILPPSDAQNINYSTNTKFCTACGTSNAKDVPYCAQCGKKFLE